jgi:hypothetical protein
MLEGSRVPFILRRVDDYYKLIGACYVHAFDRKIYRCSACSGETIQQDITSELKHDPAVQAYANNIYINHEAMEPGQLYVVSISGRSFRDFVSTPSIPTPSFPKPLFPKPSFSTPDPISAPCAEVWMKLSPWVGWTQYTMPDKDQWWYWEIATTLTHCSPPIDCPRRRELQEIKIR